MQCLPRSVIDRCVMMTKFWVVSSMVTGTKSLGFVCPRHLRTQRTLQRAVTTGATLPISVGDRDRVIYDELRREAEAIEHSALLGPAIKAQILESPDLVTVISEVISARLARATSGIMLPRDKLKDACVRALTGDPRPGADVVGIMQRDPAAISYLQTIFFFKGFHAVQAQRVAANFWKKGSMSSKHVALAIQNRVSELWAVDIHPVRVLSVYDLMSFLGRGARWWPAD